jgi:quinone-modifying oxidoreductase subunit QmoA
LQNDAQNESQRDAHNLGLTSTKAIYLPHAMAYPNRFVVDGRACKGSSCAKCVDACTVGAIDLSEQPSTEVFRVGAVVVATGWRPYDARKLTSLGFGSHPDIITNLMLERYASPQGPTQGRICCPSDGREPRSVVFVQCAGSRDRNHLPYCSGVCCAATAKHVLAVRSALPNATIKVFAIDIRTLGKLETFYAKARELPNVSFHRGKVARVEAINNVLHLRVEDTLSGTLTSESADLVVLATGMVPSIRMLPLPFDVLLDEHHFGISDPTGILFAGCAKRPFSVAESVRDATAAALHAIQHQAVRGT